MRLIGHPASISNLSPRQATLTLLDDSFDAVWLLR
jgi:hypothetical protein